jgi:hypothetical protein
MSKNANRLTYFVSKELLTGQINGKQFEIKAVSGGARGSTAGKAQFSLESYDPKKATSGSGKEKNERGGALPSGLWWVYPPEWKKDNKHPTLGSWVSFLKPVGNQAEKFPTRKYDKETGFFIHGTGPHGSNGCIVIPGQVRQELLLAVEKAGGVTLEVVLSEKYSPADLLRYIQRDGWREA